MLTPKNKAIMKKYLIRFYTLTQNLDIELLGSSYVDEIDAVLDKIAEQEKIKL